MEQIKAIINTRFQTLSILILSTTFSIIILAFRLKLHQSFFYLFLVWNLFLAIVPFLITLYLSTKSKLNKLSMGIWFIAWLLFLPNAPYIITDFLHLRFNLESYVWLDIILIISFSLNGLAFFCISLFDMSQLLYEQFNKKHVNSIIGFLLFLTGFGIYLGRFLRFNSWDILQDPFSLINHMINIICQPQKHIEAWAFTLIFGVFLSILYYSFKTFYLKLSRFSSK